MKILLVFCALYPLILELEAVPAPTNLRWYGLYPAAALQKEVPVVYKDIGASDIWSDCSKSSDVVKIQSVNVNPSTLSKGQPFTVNVKVNLDQEVTGGKASISLKYRGWIPVISKTYELCHLLSMMEESCPLQAGTQEATVSHSIPSYAPSGSYTGKAVAKDESGNELLCIQLSFSL